MNNQNLKLLSVAGGIALITAGFAPQAMANEDSKEELQEAKDTLREAKTMVQAMKADSDVQQAMQSAKAVFLVPNYGRAALLVGGAGGEGVLLVKQDDKKSSGYSDQNPDSQATYSDRQTGNNSQYANRSTDKETLYADRNAKSQGKADMNGWSQPMFYDMGAINAGAEIGVEAGQIAMLLMTDEALETFTQENNFSLNADAGLTIIDYSERAQATAGKGDIVIWSDTEGAYAGLSVSIEGISWDEEENNAFYGRDVSPDAVMLGNVRHNHHNPLNSSMPGTR
ncbi:lipid-binding SYLF domain-containing protein [Bowmanella dokdonensis]|uniref:Lipid-binding SYLF domain-containing protein n=1 Tax=Bowmanella dokdonensis TaxID=751969 RepID=A0A939IMG7_9ALTE|nr:lipid-binding SYLF domain-containing protein [Bowmanella dokdonensis]MBN7825298.1 lipid-binding SYLF domain-containing protein [Bowmanella dokdonensis]